MSISNEYVLIPKKDLQQVKKKRKTTSKNRTTTSDGFRPLIIDITPAKKGLSPFTLTPQMINATTKASQFYLPTTRSFIRNKQTPKMATYTKDVLKKYTQSVRSKTPPSIKENIKTILNILFRNGSRLYKNKEIYSIFDYTWDLRLYNREKENAYYIKVKLFFQKGAKLQPKEARSFRCDQLRSWLTDTVDSSYDKMKNMMTRKNQASKQKSQNKKTRKRN